MMLQTRETKRDRLFGSGLCQMDDGIECKKSKKALDKSVSLSLSSAPTKIAQLGHSRIFEKSTCAEEK